VYKDYNKIKDRMREETLYVKRGEVEIKGKTIGICPLVKEHKIKCLWNEGCLGLIVNPYPVNGHGTCMSSNKIRWKIKEIDNITRCI
jgi:hypothetical protein